MLLLSRPVAGLAYASSKPKQQYRCLLVPLVTSLLPAKSTRSAVGTKSERAVAISDTFTRVCVRFFDVFLRFFDEELMCCV